jgi:hypothetical protein
MVTALASEKWADAFCRRCEENAERYRRSAEMLGCVLKPVSARANLAKDFVGTSARMSDIALQILFW